MKKLYLIKKVDKENIEEMRKAYYDNLTAPMDDMWEEGIIPNGDHFEILDDEISLGYFVLDGEGTIMAFYVKDKSNAASIFEFILSEKQIKKAYTCTYDPLFYNQCDKLKRTVSDNSFIYKLGKRVDIKPPFENIEIIPGKMEDFEGILDHFIDGTGGPKEFLSWYATRVIKANTLTVFRLDDKIVGTGELRPSGSSEGYAIVGMIVAKDFRKKGLASYIISILTKMCEERGYKALSSTTVDNIGSQKTLEKNGYETYHKIHTIEF